MPSLRDALEAALVEDPDDLATHRAYADYLQEQGDPRGEFIQVQLALEEPNRTIEERRQLQARERELLAAHEREWFGVLAEGLLGPAAGVWASRGESWEVSFVRGWFDRLILRRSRISADIDLAELLCRAPELRLLRELVLEYDGGMSSLLLLHDPSFLTNLRAIQVGGLEEREERGSSFSYVSLTIQTVGFLDRGQAEEESFPSWGFTDFLARLPRLEEIRLLSPVEDYDLARLFALSNLNNLRLLQVFALSVPYPLEVLADNLALSSLTHLLLHPHSSSESLIDLAGARAVIQSPYLRSLSHLQVRRSDLGDVGCTEIVTSGILKRLKVLDLRHGEITDAGARILADCPDLQRLEHLDIDRNGLTQVGIDALRRVLGDRLRADDQQTAEELEQRQYLSEGDWE